ncbi:hypothetical protein V6N13_131382 [Hibiscus sabdariffa]
MLKVELDRSFNLYTLIPYAYSITDVFSASGDLNLTLLGHLVAEPGLSLIGCSNQLNDGYPRARGVVTITVGGRGFVIAPLRVNVLFQHVQNMFSSQNAKIAEAGDSWLNCQKLKLPRGCEYEFRMQYGSIGWSVGATLVYAQAVPEKLVIACIGDVTAQDVSTMLRCGLRSRIFLINNGGTGYTIEFHSIHDGPYNLFKNWNQTSVADSIHSGEGKCWTSKEELIKTIGMVRGAKKDSLSFIEVILHTDGTNKEVLEWGSRVTATNGRPPNPQ